MPVLFQVHESPAREVWLDFQQCKHLTTTRPGQLDILLDTLTHQSLRSVGHAPTSIPQNVLLPIISHSFFSGGAH